MRILSFFLIIPLFVSFHKSDAQDHRQLEKRIKKLGAEIFMHVQKGNDRGQLPKDVVFIGKSTFWEIFMINEPFNAIDIKVEEAINDERADYYLSLAPYISLRMRYDEKRDQFHILGYYGGGRALDSLQSQQSHVLDQYLMKYDTVQEQKGFGDFIINQTTRSEVFKDYAEILYNDLGLYFDFKNDTLTKIYSTRLNLDTSKGIETIMSSSSDITKAYGETLETKASFTIFGRTLRPVQMMVYKGISFILLRDQLMMIVIHE